MDYPGFWKMTVGKMDHGAPPGYPDMPKPAMPDGQDPAGVYPGMMDPRALVPPQALMALRPEFRHPGEGEGMEGEVGQAEGEDQHKC